MSRNSITAARQEAEQTKETRRKIGAHLDQEAEQTKEALRDMGAQLNGQQTRSALKPNQPSGANSHGASQPDPEVFEVLEETEVQPTDQITAHISHEHESAVQAEPKGNETAPELDDEAAQVAQRLQEASMVIPKSEENAEHLAILKNIAQMQQMQMQQMQQMQMQQMQQQQIQMQQMQMFGMTSRETPQPNHATAEFSGLTEDVADPSDCYEDLDLSARKRVDAAGDRLYGTYSGEMSGDEFGEKLTSLNNYERSCAEAGVADPVDQAALVVVLAQIHDKNDLGPLSAFPLIQDAPLLNAQATFLRAYPAEERKQLERGLTDARKSQLAHVQLLTDADQLLDGLGYKNRETAVYAAEKFISKATKDDLNEAKLAERLEVIQEIHSIKEEMLRQQDELAREEAERKREEEQQKKAEERARQVNEALSLIGVPLQ